jgi:23S rRNA pseudouridine1911/1915/1917 synthase
VNVTLEVLYEDNHLLALSKPAGLPTMGAAGDASSLLKLAKQYLKFRYQKPGNVYLGVMSRLDALATGVVLFARTSKAARRLTEQFRQRAVDKVYLAIVQGTVRPARGTWVDWLVHDDRKRCVRVVHAGDPAAKRASLRYRRLKAIKGYSIVLVRPRTGRKHQIRVQMSSRGHPILGDKKYGSQKTFPAGIALHARRLVVTHPVKREDLELEAPVPATWAAFGGVE